MSLLPLRPKSREVAAPLRKSLNQLSGAGAARTVRFDFYNVPPGEYLIELQGRLKGDVVQFYYPGVRRVEEAQVVSFAAGEHIELVIKLQPQK